MDYINRHIRFNSQNPKSNDASRLIFKCGRVCILNSYAQRKLTAGNIHG